MGIKDYMYKLLNDLDYYGFILQYYEAYSTSSCYIKLDYGISNLVYSEGWEFGWSQAMGVRFVLSKSSYLDLGGHVEITNQRFLFGAFVQLGIFGGHK